jgi:hypothetical protein
VASPEKAGWLGAALKIFKSYLGKSSVFCIEEECHDVSIFKTDFKMMLIYQVNNIFQITNFALIKF